MNIGIILASGVGKRMGARKNKVLLKIGKIPIICHTLKRFEDCVEIDAIILVTGEKDQKLFQEIVRKFKFKKVLMIIAGGKERQDSGYNGVRCVDKMIEKKKDLILVFHNGANPFVSHQEISGVIASAKKHGAAVVAHKTKDTIRKVDKNGLSLGVIDRENLWNMQTPQAIRFTLAKQAFERARADKFLGTDDVGLVERLGKKVKIIEAGANNFKITTPLDLKLAEIILKKEKDV